MSFFNSLRYRCGIRGTKHFLNCPKSQIYYRMIPVSSGSSLHSVVDYFPVTTRHGVTLINVYFFCSLFTDIPLLKEAWEPMQCPPVCGWWPGLWLLKLFYQTLPPIAAVQNAGVTKCLSIVRPSNSLRTLQAAPCNRSSSPHCKTPPSRSTSSPLLPQTTAQML